MGKNIYDSFPYFSILNYLFFLLPLVLLIAPVGSCCGIFTPPLNHTYTYTYIYVYVYIILRLINCQQIPSMNFLLIFQSMSHKTTCADNASMEKN